MGSQGRGIRDCIFQALLGGVLATHSMAAAVSQRPAVAARPVKGSSAQATKGQPVVSFKEGRLTVMVQGVALERILDAISRQAGVAILGADQGGAEPVSVQLQDIPLEDGLRRLLKNRDAFFFYGVEKDAPSSLRAVWVYPKGQGRGLAPVPAKDWASTRELEALVSDPDAKLRMRAYQGLVQRKRERALDVVLKALEDGDEMVRANTLYYALRSGVELPAEKLEHLALIDASPNVRFLGLEALSSKDSPNLRSIAEQAANDPDANVQVMARQIVGRLEAAARPAEPTPRVQQNQPTTEPQ